MPLQWSPGDLDRQRAVMGLAVERAQGNRVRLWTARRQLAQRLRAAALPVGVSAAAVAAAFVLGRYVSVRAAARQPAARSAEVGRAPGASTGIRSLFALAMTLTQVYLRVR